MVKVQVTVRLEDDLYDWLLRYWKKSYPDLSKSDVLCIVLREGQKSLLASQDVGRIPSVVVR